MKVKMRLLALLLVCALLLLPATVLAVPPVPGLPLTFSGAVTIESVDAPIGTIVTAEIGAVEVATNSPGGITTAGQWGLSSIPWDDQSPGKTITFKVNGEVGGQYVIAGQGDIVVLDLDVSDTSAPTCVSQTPTGNNEPLDTVASVGFSEPMNQSSVEGAFTIEPTVPGSFGWAINTLTFTPSGDLDYDTEYTVTIGVAAADVSGNPLSNPCSWDFTTLEGPRLDVDKTVSPKVIGREGSGIGTEVSTITLTISYAGDPTGSAGQVTVIDTLPGYINLEGNYCTQPEDIDSNPDGTTTLTWNLEDMHNGDEVELCFDVSADECGKVLANVYEDSMVAYYPMQSEPGSGFGAVLIETLFPKTYLTVLCPGDDSAICDVPGVTEGPAQVSIQSIWADPVEGPQNMVVEVWVSVGNSGGERGTKSVALYINGVFESSQTISVGPGGGANALFLVNRNVPGTYTVSVEGRETEFTVVGMGPPQPAPAPPMAVAGFGGGLGTAGIIAIIVVIVALGVGLMVILRREST